MRQHTIVSSTGWIVGAALDRAGEARVRMHSEEAGGGIVFVRSDLPGEPTVRVCADNLQSMPRWTSLKEGEVWVHHTEHILAALAFLGVDNVRIEMTSDQVPMVDGGRCGPFCRALTAAGLKSQDASRRVYVLEKPVFLLDSQQTTGAEQEFPVLQDGRYIIGTPADRFSISYVFHWSHLKELPIGVAEYEADGCDPDPRVLSARSYLVETESESVRDLLGPVQQEVLMLFPSCPPDLSQEAARHKIVDFVGDLHVLGHPIQGRFVAFRSGHRIHHALVQQMIRNRCLILKETA